MENLSRRVFLERLGACTAGGAALSGLLSRRAGAASASGPSPNAVLPWSPPPLVGRPNILLIIVDQMRSPMWLSSSQMTTLNQKFLPNIYGKLRNNSYNFQQYYVAATVCTASRATLLTGLYAPQTAAYLNQEQAGASPALLPAFPTWAKALASLNPTYQDNCWWFGKWHLSNCTDSDPLRAYGFRTRTYPGGKLKNPSPNGAANEGTNGGAFGNRVFANDAQIAGDFVDWLQGEAPSAGPPSSPWCATVSLVNPHDIAPAPAWLKSPPPFPPEGVPLLPVYFPPPPFPPPGGPPALYASLPSSWNWENSSKVTSKPRIQLAYRDYVNRQVGPVTDWLPFLNQYYWLQYCVDQQVGAILSALESSGQAGNTVILFTSDHGEYAGSHGLHGKGAAAYDESIRVPLYVKFPGQSGSIPMYQMCSSVDIFGLMCDLGTAGAGLWQHGQQAYADLASRQSLWSVLYQNAPETRVAPCLGAPYILHTCDLGDIKGEKGHLVCLRTKTDANNAAQSGAKLAVYSHWDPCSTIPNNTEPDYEFYDYNPATNNNRREMGNDYFSSDAATQSALAQYLTALGSWGPPVTGLIAAKLDVPLTGTGTDGRPLDEARAVARQNFFNAVSGTGTCVAA